MALSAQVVVIGGGLAGACAALSARAHSAEVLLVARAPGASALSSGAVDFAAHGDLSVGEAAREVARTRPQHPYALLGERLLPALDEALGLLREALGLEGARTQHDKNLWLATPLGRAKSAALAQPAIAAGDLRGLRGCKLGVVALAGTQAIEARLVARGLNAALVEPGFYGARADALRSLVEIAQDFDRPGRRDELGRALARTRGAASHLFLPTLGLANPAAARDELERASGAKIFELLSAPPSVPGLRLDRAIAGALARAGVQVVQGLVELAADGALQIVRGVECQPLSARAVVLASGRFIGGGIRCDQVTRGLSETVLGLPALASGRSSLPALPTEELFAQQARGPHAALAAGLRMDSSLRPLDAQQRPATCAGGPVFVAGAALGGWDPAQDGTGLGVCAITGLVAGQAAAEAARS